MKAVNIKLILQGKEAAEFNAVKERLGILNNTDVLRFLIKQFSEPVKGEKGTPEFPLPVAAKGAA